MLNVSTVNLVADTARVMAERNLRLTPIDSTPLSELVNCTLADVKLQTVINGPVSTDEVSSYDFKGAILSASNTADDVGENRHDEVMNNAVIAVSDGLNFNNQLARNVVNPMIERVSVALSTALDTLDKNSAMPVEIVTRQDRAFWNMPYTIETFKRYEETAMQIVSYTGPALEYDPSLLMTGIVTFDEALSDYLSSLRDDGLLNSIWNRTFSRTAFKTLDAFEGDLYDSIDAGIVVFFVASKLDENPPEGTEMSSVAWNTMMTDLKTQAGRVVWRGLSRIARGRDRNEMVVSYPASTAVGSKVYVDSEVYRRFLEAGGSPEVILGALFSDRNSHYSSLLTDKDKYSEKWRISQIALSSSATGRRLETVIIALDKAVTNEINTIDEEYLNAGRQAIHQNLNDCLKRVGTRDLDDLWNLARKTICRSLFPHTDAEATLLSIDEQCKQRPELNVREAAFYAAIDQLAKWMSKLIRVENVSV